MKNKLLTIIFLIVSGITLATSIVSISLSAGNKTKPIKEDVNEINNALDDLITKDGTLESIITTLETKVNFLEKELTEVNTLINSIDTSFDSKLLETKTLLENKIESLKNDITLLKAKDVELEEKITVLVNSIVTLQDTLNTLEEELAIHEKSINDLTIKINCLEGNHVEGNIVYSYSNDFHDAFGTIYCLYCDEVILSEKVITTYNDGVISSEFNDERIIDTVYNLKDVRNMDASEFKKALTRIYQEGEKNISLTMSASPSVEMFNVILEVLQTEEDYASINLTLNGVEAIPDNAFNKDNSKTFDLKSITLPDVTKIGAYAFMNCQNLEKVTFNNVTIIEDDIFYNCNSLRTVIFNKPLVQVSENSFRNVNTNNVNLVVSTNQKVLVKYDNNSTWKESSDIVTTGMEVSFVGYNFASIFFEETPYIFNQENNTYYVLENNAMIGVIDLAKENSRETTPITVKLMVDIQIPNEDDSMGEYGLLIDKGYINLDLNGKELTAPNTYSVITIVPDIFTRIGTVLTIDDTSSDKKGKIVSEVCCISNQSAELILNGGTLEVKDNPEIIYYNTPSVIRNDSGIITINDGNINFNSNVEHLSDVAAIEDFYGVVTINGGNISALGMNVSAVKINGYGYINGGTFNCEGKDIIGDGNIILGLNEEGIGTTFIGGLSSSRTLNSLLTPGAGFYDVKHDVKITISNSSLSVTGFPEGDIIIKNHFNVSE